MIPILKESEQGIFILSSIAGLLGGVYLLSNSSVQHFTVIHVLKTLFNAAFMGIIGGALVLYFAGDNSVMISAGAGMAAVMGKDLFSIIKNGLTKYVSQKTGSQQTEVIDNRETSDETIEK